MKSRFSSRRASMKEKLGKNVLQWKEVLFPAALESRLCFRLGVRSGVGGGGTTDHLPPQENPNHVTLVASLLSSSLKHQRLAWAQQQLVSVAEQERTPRRAAAVQADGSNQSGWWWSFSRQPLKPVCWLGPSGAYRPQSNVITSVVLTAPVIHRKRWNWTVWRSLSNGPQLKKNR